MKKRKLLAMALVLCMALNLTACGNKETDTKKNESQTLESTDNSDRPDTWIADRTITIQTYVDDIGYSLPKDMASTPVGKEIKKRTGITLDVLYTPGDSDASVLASQLASGTIPDAVLTYLNDSSRPEFSLMLKAAKEEMFADVAPYFESAKAYSKYLKKGYLPHDTENNIMFREDLGGAVYITHLAVDRVDRSLSYEPEMDYIGGPYIQRSIAEALKIEPKDIRTQEQFYDLLVKIKEGNFKDDNGNPVYPLGPKYWGGSNDSLDWITPGFDWAIKDEYNLTEDGQFLHEAETEWAMKKINYIRKLLDEKLMNPEFFTMDETRSKEASQTHNSAIIADVHNYTDIIYESNEWMKLGPLDDFTGDNRGITGGKTGYGAFAISAEAENPEEIFKFFDYMSTYEGQLLAQYGVEGENYTMVDGKPVVNPEVQEKIDAGDKDWLVNNVGAGFGGSGCTFFDFITTDRDPVGDFGENRPGSGKSMTFEGALIVGDENPPIFKLIPGLKASAYLSADEMKDVKVQMSLLNYKETLVQAMFASSEKEAQKIMDNFVQQLKASGVDKYKAYLKQIYDNDPEAIRVLVK